MIPKINTIWKLCSTAKQGKAAGSRGSGEIWRESYHRCVYSYVKLQQKTQKVNLQPTSGWWEMLSFDKHITHLRSCSRVAGLWFSVFRWWASNSYMQSNEFKEYWSEYRWFFSLGVYLSQNMHTLQRFDKHSPTSSVDNPDSSLGYHAAFVKIFLKT